MNPMLAAGLFDSPWVIAAIVIIGAFVNWLSQLRQQKQQRDEERRAREAEAGAPQKPQGDFDLEETLRRWLGEQTPTASPPPIPIPRVPSTPPPPTVWQSKSVPPVIVPPRVMTERVQEAMELGEVEKLVVARLAQATEQVRKHRAAEERIRRVGRWSGLWRDRSSVRRGFVGSLIFGPPKGLES